MREPSLGFHCHVQGGTRSVVALLVVDIMQGVGFQHHTLSNELSSKMKYHSFYQYPVLKVITLYFCFW